MANVGIIGSGAVAKALAKGFVSDGHSVVLGTRRPPKLADEANALGAKVGSFSDAAQFGDLIVLAVKGTAALEVLELSGPEHLANKTVIDTTNPIADAPPVNGVLTFFTAQNDSLAEQLQKKVPVARIVKAFNSVGSALMIKPDYGGIQPTMFICGNDISAKAEVTDILTKFGWETRDMGSVEAARALESLCILWCLPGFINNQWTHAFKLLVK